MASVLVPRAPSIETPDILARAGEADLRLLLFTTMDFAGDRAPDLARLIQSLEAFRQRNPAVPIALHLLLQRCPDRLAAQAALELPQWISVAAIPDRVPLSVARNMLIEPLRGDGKFGDNVLVGFPDDDCWYPFTTLDHILQRFTANRRLDFWFCRYSSQPDADLVPAASDFGLQTAISHASSNTIFVRGSVLNRIGNFNEALGLGTPAVGGEDTDFAIRAYLAARERSYTPAILIGHRDPSPEFRARYFSGALAAIGLHAGRSPAAMLATLRKLAVGGALVLKREMTIGGLFKTVGIFREARRRGSRAGTSDNISTKASRRRVVIIVENLPLPFDRRVWQEAQALIAAGWQVSAICPATERYPKRFEEIDGVAIYRHPLPLEARGAAGFLLEYASALFHEFRLLCKIAFTRGFDVVQGCNPPDLIFLVTLPFRLFGKRFVFDHHDSSPDLYLAKFGREDVMYRMLLLAEKASFRIADRVVTANESYRETAIAVGKRDPAEVTSVYSVPDTARIRRVVPDPVLRGDARIVLGYVGIIGDQDGVDQLVTMVHHLVESGSAEGVRAVVVGDGPALGSAKALAESLGISDFVRFTGYLSGDALLAALSSFDIGIIPDPVNPYNNRISMNKVFEYSALGVPSVAYNLAETRRLLGDTGSFAEDATPNGLARACLPLIENDELRRTKGAAAKALADANFQWSREAARYVAVYDALLPAHTGAAVQGA